MLIHKSQSIIYKDRHEQQSIIIARIEEKYGSFTGSNNKRVQTL